MLAVAQVNTHLLVMMLAVSLAHRSGVPLWKHLWLRQINVGIPPGIDNRTFGAGFKVYTHELHKTESQTFKQAPTNMRGSTSKP